MLSTNIRALLFCAIIKIYILIYDSIIIRNEWNRGMCILCKISKNWNPVVQWKKNSFDTIIKSSEARNVNLTVSVDQVVNVHCAMSKRIHQSNSSHYVTRKIMRIKKRTV